MQGNGAAHYEETKLEPVVELRNTTSSPSPVDYSGMITVLATWKDILNARLLALLSVLGMLGGFGFAIYDPTPLRLWGLGIYAILCQLPILALYLRKG